MTPRSTITLRYLDLEDCENLATAEILLEMPYCMYHDFLYTLEEYFDTVEEFEAAEIQHKPEPEPGPDNYNN